MDIKIDKLISGSNGILACVSDEMILAIGKRYFELASGKEPVDQTIIPVKTPRACSTCKHGRKNINDEPCMDCDIRYGNSKWEPKMDKKRAAQILTDELNHCKIHLNDKDMDPEYYAEMNDLCMAYEFALDVLEKEEPNGRE